MADTFDEPREERVTLKSIGTLIWLGAILTLFIGMVGLMYSISAGIKSPDVTPEEKVRILQEWQRGEKNAIENPDWIDKKKGIARIPIEDAKNVFLKEVDPNSGKRKPFPKLEETKPALPQPPAKAEPKKDEPKKTEPQKDEKK